MATCNDCIHYDVCSLENGEIFKSAKKNGFCGKHKDQSRYIEPQCKVGDTVYCIVFYPAINKLSVSKGFVREIRITKNNVTINIVDCEQIKYANLNINITCDDFGRTVFFTREEAEKALKERTNK